MQSFSGRVWKVFAYMYENQITNSPFQVEVMIYLLFGWELNAIPKLQYV